MVKKSGILKINLLTPPSINFIFIDLPILVSKFYLLTPPHSPELSQTHKKYLLYNEKCISRGFLLKYKIQDYDGKRRDIETPSLSCNNN